MKFTVGWERINLFKNQNQKLKDILLCLTDLFQTDEDATMYFQDILNIVIIIIISYSLFESWIFVLMQLLNENGLSVPFEL